MTAERVLWDTSVVIDAPSASPDLVSLSVVTVMELYAGVNAAVAGSERAQRLALLGAVLSTFDPLPLDSPVAQGYARVDAAVRAAGRAPRRRLADLQIAATALAHGLPLVTHNPGDFVGLENLVDVRSAG